MPEYPRRAEAIRPTRKRLAPLRELGFTTAVVAPHAASSAAPARSLRWPRRTPTTRRQAGRVSAHRVRDATRRRPGLSRFAHGRDCDGAAKLLRRAALRARSRGLCRSIRKAASRPEFDPSLEALAPAAEGKQRVVFEPGSALMVDRAARVSRELKLDFAIVSCGQEWRRPDLAKATGATFIVPLNFPDAAQAAERRRLGAGHARPVARLGLGGGKSRAAPPAGAATSRSRLTA